MDIATVLKETAKKAPIPTLVTFLVYVIYSQVLVSEPPVFVTVLIVFFTFFISLAFIFLFGKKSQPGIIDNKISDVSVKEGDVFIGSKSNGSQSPENLTGNEVSDVKVDTGDVFIGKKSE